MQRQEGAQRVYTKEQKLGSHEIFTRARYISQSNLMFAIRLGFHENIMET